MNYQAWDFSADPWIFKFQKKKGGEKVLFLIPEIPKVPTVGGGSATLPHPPHARSIRSLAKLSSSFFKYFPSHPWLLTMPMSLWAQLILKYLIPMNPLHTNHQPHFPTPLYTYTHTLMHACTYTYTHTHTYTHIHTHTHTCAHWHIHTHVCTLTLFHMWDCKVNLDYLLIYYLTQSIGLCLLQLLISNNLFYHCSRWWKSARRDWAKNGWRNSSRW